MNAPKLADVIDPSLVRDLKARTKSEAIEELVQVMGQSPRIVDIDAYREAILAREALTSTGIGLSIAVPHVKIASVTDYVIAIGRCLDGIEYDSLDSQPVRLIFMVGASDRQAIDFVQMLAQIVNLIKDGAMRVALLEAETPEDICRLIREAPAKK